MAVIEYFHPAHPADAELVIAHPRATTHDTAPQNRRGRALP
jgi:hypothetical protein